MINIRCQICGEPIALANPLHLHRPMIGAMFLSPDPHHGFDPPFEPGTEWLGMLCPYCRKRPFITEDEVLTDEGIYKVPEESPVITESVLEEIRKQGELGLKSAKAIYGLYGPNPFDSELETEPSPTSDVYAHDRWEPKACETCGKVIKGAGPMASHMRSHKEPPVNG